MYSALIVIHLLVCALLIFVVLIQSSKGAELGAAFGGSNQTLFGGRGAATFMNKATTIVAVAFMLTSLFLAVLASDRGSIMPETVPAAESQAVPVPDASPGPVQDQPDAVEQAVPAGEQPSQQEAPVQPAE